MDFNIRNYRPDDWPAICRVHDRSRPDELRGSFDARAFVPLAQDPEDARTHLNLGWSKLSAGQPREAADHYLEALRLDPASDTARAGLVEALKARNPIYRVFLWWFLWLARLPTALAFAVLIGTVIARGAIIKAVDLRLGTCTQ